MSNTLSVRNKYEVNDMELVEIRHELEKMAKRLVEFRGSL